MSDENVDEGGQKVDDPLVDKDGKHPETVSWAQYVGVKESLGKKLDTATQKVTSLEEQLKGAINPEEHNRIKTELETTKTKHQEISDELKTTKEKSASEKREFLKGKGVPEDEIKEMSEEALGAAVKVLESYKPKPDLGGGGGRQELKGSPRELARQAYSQGK